MSVITSLAGFQVIIYGRFWVITEAAPSQISALPGGRHRRTAPACSITGNRSGI
jgi:hypothetical protein